jgi:hypothetical protein
MARITFAVGVCDARSIVRQSAIGATDMATNFSSIAIVLPRAAFGASIVV